MNDGKQGEEAFCIFALSHVKSQAKAEKREKRVSQAQGEKKRNIKEVRAFIHQLKYNNNF
jgi:hypothetical protein